MIKTASAVTLAMAAFSFSAPLFAQTPRIALYSFDDINSSRQDQIGQKLYDRLLSKLIDSGAYQVYDRQFLDRVMREQGLPSTVFDASTAVRIGKLANVAAILDGTITTYTVNQKSSEDAIGSYGTVTLSATARLTSTETGAILGAPTTSQSTRGLLFMKSIPPPQRTCVQVPFRGPVCSTPPAPSAPNVETKTTAQLLDEAIEACAKSLANDIAAASSKVPSVVSTSPSIASPVESNVNRGFQPVSGNVSQPPPLPADEINSGCGAMDFVERCAGFYLNHGITLGNDIAAEPYYRKALQIREQGPHTDSSLAQALELEARSLTMMRRPDEARDLQDQAFALRKSSVAGKNAFSHSAAAPTSQAQTAPIASVNAGATPPVVTYKVDPSVPETAKLAHWSTCSVTLSLIVETDGHAGSVGLVKGCGLGLDEAAADSIFQWRWNPGTQNGLPVRIRAQVQVNFTLY